MKAVGYKKSLPISEPESLMDLEIPKPDQLMPFDLLISVKAVAANPVDYKVRLRQAPLGDKPAVLGWDAAGVVVDCGKSVTLFKVGDEVFYAGDLTRPGSNAEFQLVDERIVGKKPKNLSFAQAAAMPLTSLTAYEALFDRLRILDSKTSKNILIIGGAGGVGSIAIQLIKKLSPHKVIATASRSESTEWCLKLGADHVLNHKEDLKSQFTKFNLEAPAYVFSLTRTETYLLALADLIAPQGKICLIDDPTELNILPFKRKSVSVHWELMFTRSLFQTEDILRQHEILNEVSTLFEAGKLVSTNFGEPREFNAANLRQAHAELESGVSIGKKVFVLS